MLNSQSTTEEESEIMCTVSITTKDDVREVVVGFRRLAAFPLQELDSLSFSRNHLDLFEFGKVGPRWLTFEMTEPIE